MSDFPSSYKIVIAGNSGTGKTSLVCRLKENELNMAIQPTIGVEFKSYHFLSNGERINLHIWDTAGAYRFRSVSKAYFRRSIGAILVFDLTDRQSFDDLTMWINDLRSLCNRNVYIILVGCKCDMEDYRVISESEAQNFAEQNQLRYFEASPKTGFNVDTIFKTIGEEINQLIKKGEIILEKNEGIILENEENTKSNNDDKEESKNDKNDKIEYEFSLSPQNLFDFPFDKYEQDFTFIVDGKKFKTSRIVADILSPTIRDMHFSDPTIDEFSINTKKLCKKNIENDNYFTDFLNLCSFRPRVVDDDAREIFAYYFFLLGNKKEFYQILPNLNDAERAIFYLEFDDVISNDLISFVANHFYEVDLNKFSNLPLSIIEQILFDENLVIDDEDSLLSFIIELYEKDSSFAILFGAVRFTNVDRDVLEEFIKKFMIEDLDTKIWQSICLRLLNSDENRDDEDDDKRYHSTV